MKIFSQLLEELKSVCGLFPDARKGRGGNIGMADFGLSAFSMFFMQSLSFLSFQRNLEKGHGRSNCQTLFGIEKIPSDNYIRDHLDPVEPRYLQPCFTRMEELLTMPALSQEFSRLDKRTLIAWDGTEYFNSYKIKCPNCSTRKRNNGTVECFHTLLSATVVAPDTTRVVPLMPEFIAPQDGTEKQDCERNAVKRWFEQHGKRVKKLNPVYLGDDLFACQPIASMITAHGDDFIFTCKETSHKTLYDFMDGCTKEKLETKIRRRSKTDTFRYRWIENVPLRDGKDAMNVNWIGFQIVDAKGKITTTMAWVTSLPVSTENVEELVACGRARWKIENESFNVLKNHGYELAHNFGHGKEFLAMTMATLNLLAFAWHAVLDLLEPPWQAARQAAGKRTAFFSSLVVMPSFVIFPDWDSLLDALATFKIPDKLLKNQSVSV